MSICIYLFILPTIYKCINFKNNQLYICVNTIYNKGGEQGVNHDSVEDVVGSPKKTESLN